MIKSTILTGVSCVISAFIYFGDTNPKTENLSEQRVYMVDVAKTEQLIRNTRLYSKNLKIEKEVDSFHIEVQKITLAHEKASIRPTTDTIREIQP